MSETPRRRSGCATVLGVGLILIGGIFLFSNLFGFSLVRVWSELLLRFAVYWPAILIVWGGYKLYQRAANPDSSVVSGSEIFLLVFLVCIGLAVGLTRQALQHLSGDVSWEEFIGFVDPEIRGPLHRFSEQHRFEVDPASPLVIENARGSVIVRDSEDAELRVSLTKRVYHHSEQSARLISEDATLDLVDGEEQKITVRSRSETNRRRAKLETDLEIRVPKGVEVRINNGRGLVRVSGLENDITVTSSYDGIEVRDVIGQVTIHGRRAPIRVEKIQGDVQAFNRHGAITARNIEGSLVAETTNASIRLNDVAGSVRLKNRHARISAKRVGGDFTVEATHTAVNAEELNANLSVETTYRPVYVKNVRDGVSIRAKNAEIEVRGVQGDVTIDSIYRPVVVVDVVGTATVRARQSRLRLDRVSGPIDVESTDHAIRITNFLSSVRAVGRHAPLTLVTQSLQGQLDLQTTYGDVDITLPATASFAFDGTIQDGDLNSDFERDGWNEQDIEGGTRWQGSFAGGASAIGVTTSHGDITLTRARREQ